MGIKVKFIDNSYGKNRNFYDTWLQDLPFLLSLNSYGVESFTKIYNNKHILIFSL